jgi:two-component system chemotaxis response regulator CheB
MVSKEHFGGGRDVIVIGTSAGGVQALQELVRGLPEDLAAAVFVVMHTSPTGPAVLPQILERAGRLPALTRGTGRRSGTGGFTWRRRTVTYCSRRAGWCSATGPRRTGFGRRWTRCSGRRKAFGPRVVGVILSGGLDDGTLGLMRIKEESGCAVVQDPQDALFPGMCLSAIQNVDVDHVARWRKSRRFWSSWRSNRYRSRRWP